MSKLKIRFEEQSDGPKPLLTEMQKNIDYLIELRSQVEELRDHLIGPDEGCTTWVPELDGGGLFGAVVKANTQQSAIIWGIQDIVLEIRNKF